MSDPLVPRVGGVLSADIAVPEHEREMRFYSRVLSTGGNPLWREDLMNNLGLPIIGIWGGRMRQRACRPCSRFALRPIMPFRMGPSQGLRISAE